MIDINKKYRYRNGKEARILCVDLIGRGLHCVVSCDNVGNLFTQTINGNYMLGRGEHDYDLIEVKEKIETWVVIDKSGYCDFWRTKDSAYNNRNEAIAVRRLEYEEGQFDD